MYDLIIIGAGPAGITAAVYSARKKMNFLVITNSNIGGQAAWSGDIENYTGYQFITGPDLASKFEEHMRRYKFDIKDAEEATALKKADGFIQVETNKSRYEAKTVIISSGKISKRLNVPGEKEFKNRGVTYCATCDAPIFSGKDVAVIGGGNSALDAAIQLVKIAARVYLININPRLGGDPVMREKVEKSSIVKIMNEAHVTAIGGDKFVKWIKVKKAGAEETVKVEGVFIEAGLLPNSGFANDIDKNEHKEIMINSRNETNVPGIFAAGDVTDVPEKQIVIAAGEGSKAALSAFKYLNKTR